MKHSRLIAPSGLECGVDEAGRGPLAGPVVAAAVVLPLGFSHPWLNDSKQMTAARRGELRTIIEREALAWSVAMVDARRIEQINILQATFEAMNEAVSGVLQQTTPELLLIDGNRFRATHAVPFRCEVKGDGRFVSIAAASVLAKEHRDELMRALDAQYPAYGWAHNQGYPTAEHVAAIEAHGLSPHHRRTFGICRAFSDPVDV